jgi:hypothetical protein
MPCPGFAGISRLKKDVAVAVEVCVRWAGSITVMTSTFVTVKTLLRAAPVKEVTVAVTVCVRRDVEFGRSVLCLLLSSV